MPRLAISDPGVDTASQVFARARAAFGRRRVSYENCWKRFAPPAPPEPPAPSEPPTAPPAAPRPSWRSIRDEISHQAGVQPLVLMKSGGRSLQTVVLRQLCCVLVRRLAGLSLPAIGRQFGLNHTTVLWAVTRMRPLIAALERDLSDDDSVETWVQHAMPLLLDHVAAVRRKHSNSAKVTKNSVKEGQLYGERVSKLG
jgi:hypothetical protein